MQQYEYYIVDNGVRIGFFSNEEECREAMKHCIRGFIVPRKEWEGRID